LYKAAEAFMIMRKKNKVEYYLKKQIDTMRKKQPLLRESGILKVKNYISFHVPRLGSTFPCLISKAIPEWTPALRYQNLSLTMQLVNSVSTKHLALESPSEVL
jgi:hypothetical protein